MSIRKLMASAAAGPAIAFGASLISPLQAQGTPRDLTADSKFIRDVAIGNLTEIRLGQLAQKNAANASVQQFGQQMVSDHTRLEDQLTAMMSKNGMRFQPGLDPQHQQEVNRLEQVSGAEFDRAYMTAMIQDHETNVNTFQNQAQAAHSSETRQFVTNGLPTLQHHLNMARQIGAQVGATTTVAASTPNPPVGAQNPPVVTQNGPVTGNAQAKQADVRADSRFILEVGADNLLEVRAGQLAASRAENSSVKQFAQRMINDHMAMQSQWSAVASKNGLAFKPSWGPLHQAKITRLESLSKKAFDRAYMTLMVQQHQDDVDYFQKEGHAARLADVRQLVDRGLPTLQDHLTLAKQIGGKVGADITPTRAKHALAKEK